MRLNENSGRGLTLYRSLPSLPLHFANDDLPLPFEPIPFFLNGVRAQGSWVAEAQENERRKLTVTLLGALVVNQDYEFEVIATDSDGLTNSARIYFDTFDPESVVIEAEDYNFESGLFDGV